MQENQSASRVQHIRDGLIRHYPLGNTDRLGGLEGVLIDFNRFDVHHAAILVIERCACMTPDLPHTMFRRRWFKYTVEAVTAVAMDADLRHIGPHYTGNRLRSSAFLSTRVGWIGVCRRRLLTAKGPMSVRVHNSH